MAGISADAARVMTIVGVIICLIATVIMIFVLVGANKLPYFIPLMLLIAGIMLVVVSLAFHTEK